MSRSSLQSFDNDGDISSGFQVTSDKLHSFFVFTHRFTLRTLAETLIILGSTCSVSSLPYLVIKAVLALIKIKFITNFVG